jgi:hypothetical protein
MRRALRFLTLAAPLPVAGTSAAAATSAAATPGAWYVVDGYNAVMGEELCADPSCASVRDAGRAASAEACQAVCTAVAANESAPCTVFAWSGSTRTCWLRTDGLCSHRRICR